MIYDENKIRKNYRKLTEFLISKKLTITTMESATSGQIASLVTDTCGASRVLKGAFVTYCNESKIIQGVPESIISKYSVYSVETACAMACAALKVYPSDIGIGVTGTMGNVDLDNSEDSVPGDLYFSIIYHEKKYMYHCHIPVQESRLMYKLAAAEEIYKKLAKIIDLK